MTVVDVYLWVHITFPEPVPDTDERPGGVGYSYCCAAPAWWTHEEAEKARCDIASALVLMAEAACLRAGFTTDGATWTWEERCGGDLL